MDIFETFATTNCFRRVLIKKCKKYIFIMAPLITLVQAPINFADTAVYGFIGNVKDGFKE